MRLLTMPHCSRNAPNPTAQMASAATDVAAPLPTSRQVPAVRTAAVRATALGERTRTSSRFETTAMTTTMVRMMSGAKTRNMSLEICRDRGGVTPLSLRNVSAHARMKPKPTTKAGTVCRSPIPMHSPARIRTTVFIVFGFPRDAPGEKRRVGPNYGVVVTRLSRNRLLY